MRRLVVVLVTLTAGLLTGVAPEPSSAVGVPSWSEPPVAGRLFTSWATDPGAQVTLHGWVPTASGARPVRLQLWSGGAWTTVRQQPSSSDGSFRFTTTLPAVVPGSGVFYRVLAPAATAEQPAVVTPGVVLGGPRGTYDRIAVSPSRYGYFDPAFSRNGRYVAYAKDVWLPAWGGGYDSQILLTDRRTGTTARISSAPDGSPGEAGSGEPRLSADGRYVLYQSLADNLVPQDDNRVFDVFLWDRKTRSTTRISQTPPGASFPHSRPSFQNDLTADGRYVAYTSDSVGPFEENFGIYRTDVFVLDRATGVTQQVPTLPDPASEGGTLSAESADLSDDGRFVVYTGYKPQQPMASRQIYAWDRLRGTISTVSETAEGVTGSGPSYDAHMSARGRFISYKSGAADLLGGATDTTGLLVHDRVEGSTVIVTAGTGPWRHVYADDYGMSAKGRFITFTTTAPLSPQDRSAGTDVYVWDRLSGTHALLTPNRSGTTGTGFVAPDAAISPDGSTVGFVTTAPHFFGAQRSDGHPTLVVWQRNWRPHQ